MKMCCLLQYYRPLLESQKCSHSTFDRLRGTFFPSHTAYFSPLVYLRTQFYEKIKPNDTSEHPQIKTRNADDTAGRKMCVCLSVILWCLFWFPSAKIHAFGTVKEDLQYDISILIPPNTSYQQFYISSIKKLSFLMGHVDQDYF